jgi:hypothetical protein
LEAACDSENHSGSRLSQVYSCAFSLQPMRGREENIDQSHRREFWVGFKQSFSKLGSNFKEANKKLIITRGSENLLKDFKNHQRIHSNH